MATEEPDGLIDHAFRLRADLKLVMRLPPDLTADEAERVGAFVKTLVIAPPSTSEPVTVSVPTAASGLGRSTKRPRGTRLVLPRGVKVRGTIKGGASTGTRVGSGRGYVNVGLVLAGGSTVATVLLPAGMVMVSKRADVQHGLLVQDVHLVVPANSKKQWVLAMYCANKSRSAADKAAEFSFGPVTEHPGLRALFAILAGRKIADGVTETVQQAVWEITDEDGLTLETRAVLEALPFID